MLDATPIAHQRSRGAARVAIGPEGRVAGLYQQGSAKAILPAAHGDAPEVVFLNTSGGLTGGDRLSFSLSVADGARTVAATQTAERVYASLGSAARAEVTIDVGAGATCAWLPLGVETLVLGRQAMGETVARVSLSDVRRVWREGRLIHAEQIGFDDALMSDAQAKAGLAGARVIASLVYLANDAEDRLAAIRREIDVVPAASAWRGRLVIRMMHGDSWTVRQVMARAVACLAGRVPRVWQM